MKFKIGDKVRVRKDLKIDGVYGIWCFNSNMSTFEGKELTVEKVYDESYRVKENAWYWTDEMLEEVKENKMEKNFKEVIRDIKEGEVWEYRNFKIKMKDNALEILFGDCPDIRGIYFNEYHKFKLKNKEYTFQEAFAAYEKGKEIQSAVTGIKYQKRRLPYETEIKDCCFDGKDWYEIEDGYIFSMKEIRGSWYINE